jgi:flagellar hook-associated protein 3 FlgL
MISSTTTSAFFDRATQDIGALRAQANTLQSQISSGQKLDTASQDPVAAARLRELTRAQTLSETDTSSANRANADLTLADTTLQSFADAVTQAQGLTTQAASAVLNTSQRASIGVQLAQIHSQLVNLANTRDSAGNALFGGQAAGQAYTLDAAGNASYTGTASATQVSLGEGQSVATGLTGPEFLNFNVAGAPTDLLTTIKTLSDALQSSSGNPQAAAQASLTALNNGLDSIANAQTVVGSRLAFVDLTNQHRQTVGDLRTTEQGELGGTDIASTVVQLQQTMLVLQASQDSFAKLASLNLFDKIN